jgi:hypothetical protein
VSDVVHLGVVNVHDPATGWATLAVAAVAWTYRAIVAWSWMPRSDAARQLRVDLDTLDPPAQIRWLAERCEDPGIVHAVDLVEDVAADSSDLATVSAAVEDLLDAVIVGTA